MKLFLGEDNLNRFVKNGVKMTVAEALEEVIEVEKRIQHLKSKMNYCYVNVPGYDLTGGEGTKRHEQTAEQYSELQDLILYRYTLIDTIKANDHTTKVYIPALGEEITVASAVYLLNIVIPEWENVTEMMANEYEKVSNKVTNLNNEILARMRKNSEKGTLEMSADDVSKFSDKCYKMSDPIHVQKEVSTYTTAINKLKVQLKYAIAASNTTVEVEVKPELYSMLKAEV